MVFQGATPVFAQRFVTFEDSDRMMERNRSRRARKGRGVKKGLTPLRLKRLLEPLPAVPKKTPRCWDSMAIFLWQGGPRA